MKGSDRWIIRIKSDTLIYLNKYRKDPNFINSNRYFLSRLKINGEDKYFSTISDVEFEEEAIRALNTAM